MKDPIYHISAWKVKTTSLNLKEVSMLAVYTD